MKKKKKKPAKKQGKVSSKKPIINSGFVVADKEGIEVHEFDGYQSHRTAKDLTPWELNPRRISNEQKEILQKGLEEFGDLGGIVYNKRLGCLLGGHMRSAVLPKEARISITKVYADPTRTGTVSEGFIESHGERFSYREVDWDHDRHAQAAILANKAGGDWEYSALKDIMNDLDAKGVDLQMTGFTAKEVEDLMTYSTAIDPTSEVNRGVSPEDKPGSGNGEQNNMRKIELWYTAEDYDIVMNAIMDQLEKSGMDSTAELVKGLLTNAQASS